MIENDNDAIVSLYNLINKYPEILLDCINILICTTINSITRMGYEMEYFDNIDDKMLLINFIKKRSDNVRKLYNLIEKSNFQDCDLINDIFDRSAQFNKIVTTLDFGETAIKGYMIDRLIYDFCFEFTSLLINDKDNILYLNFKDLVIDTEYDNFIYSVIKERLGNQLDGLILWVRANIIEVLRYFMELNEDMHESTRKMTAVKIKDMKHVANYMKLPELIYTYNIFNKIIKKYNDRLAMLRKDDLKKD